MEQLIRYIETIVKLSPQAICALNDLAVKESFLKNEYILQEGQICRKIWFLSTGMVRKFHLHEGNEITSWAHTENEIFTSLHSYGRQTPAEEYIQACENTELISISRHDSEKLAAFPEFTEFSNTLMEKEFVNIDLHTRAFNQRDAKGKYDYLREIAPELVKRAKLKHIASILGISQETLSRVRGKI